MTEGYAAQLSGAAKYLSIGWHSTTDLPNRRKPQSEFEMASHYLADIIRQTSQLTSEEQEEEAAGFFGLGREREF